MRSDQELVTDSLRGETRSFATLVEKYRYAVFGLCLNCTRDFDAAEDAAQETFVKAFLNLRRLQDAARFAPWLKQIAVNECRMGRRRTVESLGDHEEKTLTAAGLSPAESALASETRRQLLAALSTLSDEQQQIITLFYLEGQSLKQIAAFLDLAPQAANQRLYRARRHLKKEMLNMVEETLGSQKLPNQFTEEVIESALERGRSLLEEKQWTEARLEFRKVTELVADRADAYRWLARALDGEVDEMLEGKAEEIDEKLINEALVAHEEAFRLGARDEETMWNLAGMYDLLKRPVDRARMLTLCGEAASDPQKAFKAFERASWNYCREDRELAIDLHRRALEIVGIDDEVRLLSYFAARLEPYVRSGEGDRWLAETQSLFARLEPPISRTHYMYYRDRIWVLGEMGRQREALSLGNQFLEELETGAAAVALERRWWISHILGRLVRTCHQLEDRQGATAKVAAARDNLNRYRQEWRAESAAKATDEAYRRFFGYAASNLAGELRKAGFFDDAIEITEMGLEAREDGNLFMALACAHMGKGDVDGTRSVMQRMHESASENLRKWAYFGGAQRWFADAVFDPVREDPELVAIVRAGGREEPRPSG